MNTLFDLNELEQSAARPPGETCRNCIHKYKHYYNNTLYCGKQKQRGTSYGNRKIKASNPACYMFEKKETPVKK